MTQIQDSTDANFVLTLDEITNLTEAEGKPADTLLNVVALIASRFRTDVCSAYLLEPDRSHLVLAATLGLHPKCIGTLRMQMCIRDSTLPAQPSVRRPPCSPARTSRPYRALSAARQAECCAASRGAELAWPESFARTCMWRKVAEGEAGLGVSCKIIAPVCC